MAVLIGIVSQKGGVGKSMLSRLLATEYARVNWSVLIADMDNSVLSHMFSKTLKLVFFV
ncbi:hypothetical protein [Candidatus Cardinium hertigii]|uniref:nucleotide-binding protein n=1 Tax=Candidatus Cardinium hertigii TaxID=247481 RepID=UPI003D7DC80E